MSKKLPLLFLILAVLACNLPFGTATPDAPPATLDVTTLVAENLTAAALGTAAASSEVTGTPAPEPVRTNLNVVYARGGNIILWRESASPINLTASGQDDAPAISDDGQVIVFLRNGELFSIRADGSGERQLVSQAFMDGFRAADMLSVRLLEYGFAPGSHEVYFNLLGETDAFPVPLNDLQRADADTGAINVVLSAGSGGGVWTFSPDTQWLALTQGDKIRVLRRDGSDDRVVFTFKFVSTYSEWTYYPQVVWKNDSTGFYTVIPASAALDNLSEPSRFYYVPLGGEAARLAEFVTVPVWQSFPSISPNGAQVAYARQDGASQALHVIDASTADRVYTTAPSLSIMGWNPDSLRVVYRTDDPANVSALAFGAPSLALNDATTFSSLRWVSENRYLFLSGEELRVRQIPDASILLDSGVTSYDFVVLP